MSNGDGKFVVVQGTERVSGLKDTQQEAETEREKIAKKLAESKGNGSKPDAPAPAVKQNLLG
jgi:hypothetical protein